MFHRIICIVLLIFFASGCGPTVRVLVDSIDTPAAGRNKVYILLPADTSIPQEDLRWNEFSQYIHKALISNGFVPAQSIEEANVAIFLAYGIGEPKENVYSYAMPIWGQTGVSSSNTYGTYSFYGGYGNYSGTTTYTPKYGITGYVPMVGRYTTYNRYMFLNAFDLNEYKSTKKTILIWKTSVSSAGRSGDIREILPIMVAAARKYIGNNTGKIVQIDLMEDSKEVLEIKGVK